MSAAHLAVSAAIAPVMDAPRADATQVSQALFGETLDVLEDAGEWLLCRLRGDGYEGHVHASLLAPPPAAPATHTPAIPQTLLFPAPDIKSAPARPLYMGARLRVSGRMERFSLLEGGGYVITSHLRPLDAPAPDAAGVAEMFLHAPYLWGGRSVAGLDCSGLVQMALTMAGHADVPRDSGDQARRTGAPMPLELTRGGRPRRGDLVFWKGHVAMMLDAENIIHANGHHMRVAIEPLRAAMARIEASGGGKVTSLRRP